MVVNLVSDDRQVPKVVRVDRNAIPDLESCHAFAPVRNRVGNEPSDGIEVARRAAAQLDGYVPLGVLRKRLHGTLVVKAHLGTEEVEIATGEQKEANEEAQASIQVDPRFRQAVCKAANCPSSESPSTLPCPCASVSATGAVVLFVWG